MNWIDEETFKKLEVHPNQSFYQDEDFNPNWISKKLEPNVHLSLYEYFNAGGELLHRANSNGELELLVLINDVEPMILAKAKLGIEIITAEDNRFSFYLLIFDRDDDPLKLPFIFELNDDIHRYRAAALCEQLEIPLYFLQSIEETIIVNFSKRVIWPEEIRGSLRKAVVTAYNLNNSDPRHILASSLEYEEVVANGWSYQFDVQNLVDKYSEEGVTDFINKVINESVRKIANHKYKGINKGPFLIWMHQRIGIFGVSGKEKEGIIIFITPFYSDRATRVKSEVEPCYDYMSSCTGFIRAEGGNPIYENAFPLYRYEEGELLSIHVDNLFLHKAAALKDKFIEVYSSHEFNVDNVYRRLLETENI